MELRRYLSILGAYRWPLILIPVIAALVALGATFVISPRYVGTAVVQLIPEEIEPRTVTLRSQDGPSNVAIGLKDPTELLSQSIIESLSSHDVAAHVTDELKLNDLPEPQGWNAFKSQVRQLLDDAWALLRYGYVAHKPREEATVDRVSQSLETQLVRGSYYMEVYATWRDPETAARMSNVAVQAVLQQARQVASASAAEQRKFLDTQRLEAKKQVDIARTALLDYSSSNKIVSGISVGSALVALDQARAALRQNELALIDAHQRLAQARQQSQAIPADVVTQLTSEQPGPSSSMTSQTTSPNPVYQSLQDRVATLAQDVAALETRQGGFQDDQALAEARRRLDEAQQQLSDTSAMIEIIQNSSTQSDAQHREETTSSPSPIFQSIQRDALILEQEVAGLDSRSGQLQADVKAREQDVQNLTLSDGRLQALSQELALASDTYSRRTTDWYNALLEEARPVAPIRLINPASVPVYPAYPIKIFWALIGAAAGLAAAIVLVFMRYNTDISLRTSAEAEAALALPLLALVPAPRNGTVKSKLNGVRRGGPDA
jgi:polysaccharide biosynthesis transport protein